MPEKDTIETYDVRKGRDYLTPEQWDKVYEQYAERRRLDGIFAALSEPKHQSFKSFQNSFYNRRSALQARAEARKREFRLAEPFERCYVRHRRGKQFEILAKRESGSVVFGPLPMQEAHWVAERLNG